jgi:hypothetical protein
MGLIRIDDQERVAMTELGEKVGFNWDFFTKFKSIKEKHPEQAAGAWKWLYKGYVEFPEG